jgi:predicted nucleic acid-binding protein
MPAEFFLDTNVFVYTFDRRDRAKRSGARALVERSLETGNGVVSFQVLQEFLNVALHRFERPLTAEQAVRYVLEVLEALCAVFSSFALYERAISLQR